MEDGGLTAVLYSNLERPGGRLVDEYRGPRPNQAADL